jgi:hypothetical protein
MAYEHKEGQISIFENNKKMANQPSHRGTGLFQGQKIKIALWEKQGNLGTFYSGKIELDNYVKSDPGAYHPAQSDLPLSDPITAEEEPESELPF